MWHVFAPSSAPSYPLSWRQAWEEAAIGEGGFYRRADCRPADHFRTSAHIGGAFAAAIFDRLRAVDHRLGHPPTLTMVDVGAGSGELLNALTGLLRDSEPALAARVQLIGVDVRNRPRGLGREIDWISGLAPCAVPANITGMIIATELLDDVAIEIAEVSDSSDSSHGEWRYLHVDDSGSTFTGDLLTAPDLEWAESFAGLTHTTPLQPGLRIEIGRPRDTLAADLASRLTSGDLLVIDYVWGTPEPAATANTSLRAFRHGHPVQPSTDGSMNITAAVNQGSLLSTLSRFGHVHVQDQSSVLAGYQNAPSTAELPMMASLQWSSQWQGLTNRDGLGAHSWVSLTTTNTAQRDLDAKHEVLR